LYSRDAGSRIRTAGEFSRQPFLLRSRIVLSQPADAAGASAVLISV